MGEKKRPVLCRLLWNKLSFPITAAVKDSIEKPSIVPRQSLSRPSWDGDNLIRATFKFMEIIYTICTVHT
ncbi:hypothetical protein TWF569_007222 [Orbilia oligospora]|uniref:Uncharacterized protein n=1 Tax=Orbilia oligospora TaxID=2813651 RepID=A0A7C8J014_ORBOL|nr:hypothetical protein TWF102_011728 [Orbilia oligospora]KAF3088051.1 hypothetical protein TWF103_001240 [Orbilia oligospora]KAF3120581.1 hypothetical protein TWF594_003719 [Orbilia oligospora]KAF3144060.1 hypothetical protein TWF569_007222 [Orbilia oligospora]